MSAQSVAATLTKLTVGGQSVIYALFRKQLGCEEGSIRRLELTYFSAAITTAVYLRLGKHPNREQALDLFAKDILKNSIPSAKEQISFGSAVAQYQKRYAEYDRLLALVINPKESSTGNPAVTLLLHLFECATGQSARSHMLEIAVLAPLVEGYILDHIQFVQTKM